MLVELRIRDFALIDECEIELGPGLNVLTGETGAGKSIIIDGVAAIVGGRVNADEVRQGAEAALIEAAFDVQRGPPGAARGRSDGHARRRAPHRDARDRQRGTKQVSH